jgi:hypothetical protein
VECCLSLDIIDQKEILYKSKILRRVFLFVIAPSCSSSRTRRFQTIVRTSLSGRAEGMFKFFFFFDTLKFR